MHPQPSIPMKALQVADKALGWVACLLLQPLRLWPGLRKRRGSGRILLIKFWGIGSLQLLTPAVTSLRARRPDARLTLLTLAENVGFASGLEVFDEVQTLNVRSGGWFQITQRIATLLRELRKARYEEVFDFEFFTRFSAVISLLSGAPTRHGFHSPSVWRGRLHTRAVPFNRYWHVARNFRALAGGEDASGVEPEDLTPYRFQCGETQRVSELLGRESAGPLVVLNANAGSLSLERRWPPERFAQLARTLAHEDGARVIFVGAPAETTYTGRVVALAEIGLDLAGQLSIGELCALLARADVVVSNDSGPMHLAAALGAPTLGLFGPETPVMYRPLGPHARALWSPPVCSPCINVHDNKRATCHHGQPECLMNITVDEVLASARGLLAGQVLFPLGPRPEPVPSAPSVSAKARS